MNQQLLKKRMEEAPRMEPVDAVKLVYQSEFGCGHLLGPEAPCAARIAQEIAHTHQDASIPAFVEIGGGMGRVDLKASLPRRLSPILLARMMQETERRAHGTIPSFEKRLEGLQVLCQEGALPFAPEQLESYLTAYKKAGYPPVSHSEGYHEAYSPAYRVVLAGYRDALSLILSVQERLAEKGRVILAIDGDCGSGKTTLARLLAPLWDAAIIPIDDFFLPVDMRTAQRLSQPGGNVHYERFGQEVLKNLLHNKAFSYERYDCQTGQLMPRPVAQSPVTIIEGSYCHHPYFAESYKALGVLRCFISVDSAEQLRRLERRNSALLSRFQSEWIPLEKSYFQAYDIGEKAELTIFSKPWEEDA